MVKHPSYRLWDQYRCHIVGAIVLFVSVTLSVASCCRTAMAGGGGYIDNDPVKWEPGSWSSSNDGDYEDTNRLGSLLVGLDNELADMQSSIDGVEHVIDSGYLPDLDTSGTTSTFNAQELKFWVMDSGTTADTDLRLYFKVKTGVGGTTTMYGQIYMSTNVLP